MQTERKFLFLMENFIIIRWVEIGGSCACMLPVKFSLGLLKKMVEKGTIQTGSL